MAGSDLSASISEPDDDQDDDSMTKTSSAKPDTFFQVDYDDYIESTPLEARFDPATIQMLVVEAIPKHAAYEMSFEEYLKQRSRFSEYDGSEKKRLSFYLPLYPALRSHDFADDYRLSLSRFMVTVLELGLIHILYDYNAEVQTIKQSRKQMGRYLTNERSMQIYSHIARYTIELGSSSNTRNTNGGQGSRHFSPSCQDWFYNALTELATSLGMSNSDMAYLCWCNGITQTLRNDIIDNMAANICRIVLDQFNLELNMRHKRILAVLSEIKDESELLNYNTTALTH